MTRGTGERLDVVVRACELIREYVDDDTLPELLVHDAVRMRLVEIGEAVRMLPDGLTAAEPSIPWRKVSLLADRLTRNSVDTTPAVVLGTARTDVPLLCAAARRLRAVHADATGYRPGGAGRAGTAPPDR